MTRTAPRNLLLLALTFAALPAAAHSGHGSATIGFLAGFAHPFSGLDHLLAMLAVGVWSTTTTRRLWLAPLSFAATLLLGALLATNGLSLPAVEPMIAASVLVLGLLIMARVRLPESAAATLVAGFALFHGAAHGTELGAEPGTELAARVALAGMTIATALLHGTGIAAGCWLTMRSLWWQRGIGAGIALTGAGVVFNLA